jgi:hypothetical protein
VWNSNLLIDEIIGKAEIPFDKLKENNDKEVDYTLDTGGSIQIKVHYPLTDQETRALKVKSGKPNLLDGNFDEKTNRTEFQEAVKAWRGNDCPSPKHSPGTRTTRINATRLTTSFESAPAPAPVGDSVFNILGDGTTTDSGGGGRGTTKLRDIMNIEN